MVMAAIIKVSHISAEAPVKHKMRKIFSRLRRTQAVWVDLCQDGMNGDPASYCNHTNNKSVLQNGSFMIISDNAPAHSI